MAPPRILTLLALLFLYSCSTTRNLDGVKLMAYRWPVVEREAEVGPSPSFRNTTDAQLTAAAQQSFRSHLEAQKVTLHDAGIHYADTGNTDYFFLNVSRLLLEESRLPKYDVMSFSADSFPPDLYTYSVTMEVYLYDYKRDQPLGHWSFISTNKDENYRGPTYAQRFDDVYAYLARESARKAALTVMEAMRKYRREMR